jgi:hypothetical protein
MGFSDDIVKLCQLTIGTHVKITFAKATGFHAPGLEGHYFGPGPMPLTVDAKVVGFHGVLVENPVSLTTLFLLLC